jgi:hypothetical protein
LLRRSLVVGADGTSRKTIIARDLDRSVLGDIQGARQAGREEAIGARVTGLGHVGIYVRDLERVVAFYRDVMGMQVTKQNWGAGVVFLSADPEVVDHEIALMRGRLDGPDPHLIQPHLDASRRAR